MKQWIIKFTQWFRCRNNARPASPPVTLMDIAKASNNSLKRSIVKSINEVSPALNGIEWEIKKRPKKRSRPKKKTVKKKM